MVGGPIASATTCPAWTTWSWTPRRSRRSSTARSPTGTTRRSRRSTRARSSRPPRSRPFHRSDDSGTTDNFTKYLIAAAAGRLEVRRRQGVAGQGRPGRRRLLRRRRAGQADRGRHRLLRAVLRRPPTASRPSRSTPAPPPRSRPPPTTPPQAIAAAKVVGTGNDLALKLDYTTKADGAYPIILVTYEIACDKGNKADTLPADQVLPDLHRQRRTARSSSPTPATPPLPDGDRRQGPRPPSPPCPDPSERAPGPATGLPGTARPRRSGAPPPAEPSAPRRSADRRSPWTHRPDHRRHPDPPDRHRPPPPSRRAARGATRPGDRIFPGLSRGSGILLLVIMAAIAVFLTYRADPRHHQGPRRTSSPPSSGTRACDPPVFGIAVAGLRHRGLARSSRWSSRSRSRSASRCSSRTTRRAGWPARSAT